MKMNYEIFNTQHFTILAICILGLVSLVLLATRISESHEKKLRLAFCFVLWFQEISLWLYRIQEGSFSITEHLPFHMCSISVLLLPIMLHKKSRMLYTVLYFWGLGGATQALLTPTVTANQPDFLFWQFFFSHIAIVTAVVYATVVFSFRLTLKDFIQACAATIALLPFVGLINWMIDGNYFFIAHKPKADTILNTLPEWPYYIFPLIMIGFVVFFLIYIPFPLYRLLKKRI